MAVRRAARKGNGDTDSRYIVNSVSPKSTYVRPMTKLNAILAATVMAAPLTCGLAVPSALASPFDGVAQIEVLPGWQTPTGTHMAGLRVTLQPGWKTYWRAPGDAGIPPQFSWAGSENLTGAQYHWPVPEVLAQNDLFSIGYSDSLVLPIELSPADSDAPITVAGEVHIGVCEDICVPMTLQFAAELPVTGARNGAIIASLLNQPLTAEEAGVTKAACEITPISDGLQVTATVEMPSAGGAETVIVEAGNPEVWVSPTDVVRDGPYLRATVDMIHMTSSSFALDRSAVRITVLGSNHAVDVQGCTAQ